LRRAGFLETPDGRYIVVRGRLWRKSNPHLDDAEHDRLVHELMDARRAVKEAVADDTALQTARSLVDQAKVGLGERGAVWWTDGAPDFNRHMAKNSPYAQWYKEMTMTDNTNARDAVEDSGNDKARAAENPAAGPHAKKELTDDSKTPGSGALPNSDEESVEPGAG
jgi:hypothetical protein